MLNTPSLGSGTIDPNTQRALEQLAIIVGDVEQRLTLVKSTLAQIAPALGNPPQGLRSDPRSLGLSGVPNFQQGLPNFGAPFNTLGAFGLVPQQIPQQFGQQIPQFGIPTYAPFFQGVSAPVSIPQGIIAPTFPFRLG